MRVRVSYTPKSFYLFILLHILKVIFLKGSRPIAIGDLFRGVRSSSLVAIFMCLRHISLTNFILCELSLFLLYLFYQERIKFSHLETSLFYPFVQSWEISASFR